MIIKLFYFIFQQLKQQRDKIKQFQKRIVQQLESERLIARELLKNGKKEYELILERLVLILTILLNFSKALLILKKKKRMEGTLEKAENQMETLEKMVSDIEFAQIEVAVIEGLKVGNESLKQLHDLLSIDQIEDILDETRAGVDKQRVRQSVVLIPNVIILSKQSFRKSTNYWVILSLPRRKAI